MNLDKLNKQLDPYKDGVFDYIEGITVNSATGEELFSRYWNRLAAILPIPFRILHSLKNIPFSRFTIPHRFMPNRMPSTISTGWWVVIRELRVRYCSWGT
jgi:hypothetical protein